MGSAASGCGSGWRCGGGRSIVCGGCGGGRSVVWWVWWWKECSVVGVVVEGV